MREPGRLERAESVRGGQVRRFRPEEQLARWGRWQHRQITVAQLHEVGWNDSLIGKRVRSGRLHPVFTGVYSLGGPPRTRKEIWMAATLTFGPGTRLAAGAAVDLYGWLRYPLGDLFVLTATRRRSRQGITTMHRAKPGRSRYIDLIPVTGPEQTVLDCAMTVRSDKAYRRIVRAAQIEDTSHVSLLAFSEMNRGRRGVNRLRKELADGASPTRSANEDEVLEIFRKGGEPLANHRFAPDLEGDLYFPKLGVVIEVDSPLHDGPTAAADDERKDERYRALGLRPYRLRQTQRA